MATSLERLENEGQIVIYDRIPTIWWNFGENRSGRSCDHFAQRYILKTKTRN